MSDNLSIIRGSGTQANLAPLTAQVAAVAAMVPLPANGRTVATLQQFLNHNFARSANVLDYGAVGDGTTGDSAAIQAAVNGLGTGNGTVFFPTPAVSYVIDTAIDLSGKINIVFTGPGAFSTLEAAQNGTKLQAGPSLVGPMFTCNTAVGRGGGYDFKNLIFLGNSQPVDAFYLHGTSASNQAAFMIEFSACWFESMRTGLWIGDFTNEGQLTYLLGLNVYRCIFRDVVRPIVADAAGFDGLHLDQVWILDPVNRMTRAISILMSGCAPVFDNLWISGVGTACTEVIYFAFSSALTMRDSALEANVGTPPTYIGLFMPTTGGVQVGGVILDNCRFNHTNAAAVAISIDTPGGAEIRSSRMMGNVNVGPTCHVTTQNVTFLGAFGYTGHPENVFEDGVASGTWTPTVIFNTLGDLAVTYAVQLGRYTKVGKLVTAHFNLITGSFVYTTSAGALMLGPLPFISEATYIPSVTLGLYRGVTDAAHPFVAGQLIPSTQYMNFYISGSGGYVSMTIATVPSGGTVALYGTVTYKATV